MKKRHRLQFPKKKAFMNQNEAYFYLQSSGEKKKNEIP